VQPDGSLRRAVGASEDTPSAAVFKMGALMNVTLLIE